MSTIRDALKSAIENCKDFPLLDGQHHFFTKWLKVAGEEPWFSIAPDMCSKVVGRAGYALALAKRDNKAGVDRYAAAARRERQRILHAITHMRALRDYYGETLARADPEFTGHTAEEVAALADKVAWCNREGKALVEEARRLKVQPTVHVSNQPEGREKRIFMQRLHTELTMPLFGRPYDKLVMGLTEIAYTGDTTLDDVKNARKKMPKS
jgi:hypothetical protein